MRGLLLGAAAMAALLAGVCSRLEAGGETVARVSISAAAELKGYPVLIPLTPAPIPRGTPALRSPDGRRTDGQLVRIEGRDFVAALVDLPGSGARAVYEVSFDASPVRGASRLEVRPEDEALAVYAGDSLMARHNSTHPFKPYLWPVFSPGGVDVTRSYPMRDVPGEDQDHVHHRGLWFTHGDVNGVDFWGEGEPKGRTVQRSVSVSSGPVCAVIRTVNDWVAPDGRKICEDERTQVFWKTPAGNVIDYRITLKATEGALRLGDTKEGTFAIRVPKWMTVKNGTGHILNSAGDRDGAAWGKRAAWVIYWGPSAAGSTGVAMAEDPQNFRFPTYWHARDYGLFAANPFGVRDFTGDKDRDGSIEIPAGGSLTLAYRVLVFDGDPEKAGVPAFAAQAALRRPFVVTLP
ncbi:MAG: PmoA family protein [Armatimonadota bacterium]